MSALLSTTDLVAGYTDVDVLHGVTIDVGADEIVAIIGPNGAGKSTLIKAIAGLLTPRAGRVTFDGEDIAGQRPHRIVSRGLAYVPQLDNVFPNLSVEENLEIGAFSRPRGSSRSGPIYEWFPALAERRRQRAATLSGGQRQMLAFGRALMSEPRLLLLDEPSAGLAPTVVDDTFKRIRDINARGVAILLVEQNARRSLEMADRGYVLDLGRNRFEGRGRDLLHDPKVTDLYLGGGRRLTETDIEP